MSATPGATPSAAPASMAPLDVQILQTAAALENLAVELYTMAGGLKAVAAGQERLRALIRQNLAHHSAHAAAFNRAAVAAGGRQQHAADARYAGVAKRLAGTKDPVSLATLLEEIEDVMTQTFARFAPLAGAAAARSLFVDTASVEAQHASELLIVVASPGGAGTAGIPRAVYPTSQASAVNEGAVR